MSDLGAGTPRVFLARHGETEWTKNGRYTGNTELELTENGAKQVLGTAKHLVGTGKLIDPTRVIRAFVSPRQRAQMTLELLFKDAKDQLTIDSSKVSVTEAIAEWDYGEYEGLVTPEIRALRQKRGLDKDSPWDIWRDGCEGGEDAQQVTERLDGLIEKIHDIQRPYMHGEKPVDVVLVAHGHILRAITKRWLKYPMATPLAIMLPPGAIGVLSYDHHSIEEPALWIGMALPLEAS